MMGGLMTGGRRAAAVLVAVILGAGVTACETTGGGGLTSQYFGPEGGGFYRYGNFCGPGWPEYPQGNTPQQNIALINAIEPMDDLDRVCRAHDRCYFQYGMDNPQCDSMFAEMLRDSGGGEYLYATSAAFLENEFSDKCANLAAEMLVAVAQFKQEDFFTQLQNDDDLAMATGLILGFNALRNMSSGFPDVPGLCFFKPEHLRTAYSPAEAAFRAAGGGSLSSFESFAPGSEKNLAAGRAALAAYLAAQAAAAEKAASQ